MLLGVALATALAWQAGGCGSSSSPPDMSEAGPSDGGKPEAQAPDAAADGSLPPLESEPPAQIPEANRLDVSSTPVVYDALRGGVWTANGDVGSISYVDIDTPKLIAEIPIGQNITSVALSPDFRWIAAVDRSGATVTLVDATTREVVRAIPAGTHPRAAVWDSWNPRYLYVAVEDDGAVAVIDRSLGVFVEEIPVGRLPSGLTSPKLRHDLYVNHRIDAMVTRVSLDTDTVALNVPLAIQPADPSPTVPQGKPFAFESGAMVQGYGGDAGTINQGAGNILWMPHELLAPTHPFQFQETVFPAVSDVDFSVEGGQEITTDPNDPNGVIAGRKLLFDAINIPDPTGATSIMSQLCAVTMHPNGEVAYVLACGSEDLLTFDLTSGIAVDLLRNLPGDHPVGVTIDTLGQRLFVVSDQSKTLMRFDTAGGDLTQHVTELGTTIPLVAKDTVAPALRSGLTLFYRANSSKGTLATTGNNWLSCGACHLDGFVSTNKFLFEASDVVNEALDARIGHIGLTDLFSTAPTPTSPTFNPHDILVAFTDMGGLSPDRTGATRTGAVQPSAPTAAAKTMSAEVAEVVARDLPVGPTWLLPGAMPNESYDTQWCGQCHAQEYAAWQQSAHAHSAVDPMMQFCTKTEVGLVGPQFSRLCAGCHDPVSVRLGDTSFSTPRNVTCLGCHDVSRLIQAGGNGDVVATAQDWTLQHAATAAAELPRLRSPQFCAGCHEQFVPGNGLSGITTYEEWSGGPYAAAKPQTICIDCHMAAVASDAGTTVADHRFVGGNVYMATQYGGSAMISATNAKLQSGIMQIAPASPTSDGGVAVKVTNVGIGHDFPTGVTDIREAWVELQALDASGNVLAHFGGPDASGVLPSTAARLGIDIADADGGILLEHQLSQTARITFDQRVPAGGSLTLNVTPGTSPPGTTELDAVLYYRNLRTTYYQAATGDAGATSPSIELAREKVP